jgi:hypothetical protein
MPVMHCRLKVVTYNKYKQDTYGITTGVMPNNCNAVTWALGIIVIILQLLAIINKHCDYYYLEFGY